MPRIFRTTVHVLSEFSVVFALMAILAFIALPVFNKARESSEKASCVSNLRRIGMAWQQYTRDYDGHLMRFSTAPNGAALPSPTNKTTYWWGSWDKKTLKPSEGLLFPYVKSSAVYSCPAFHPTANDVQGNLGYGYNTEYLSPTHYSPDYTEATPQVVSIAELKQPTQTVVFADAAQFAFKSPSEELRASSYLSPPTDDYPNFHGRHNAQGNVLWADGHVSARMPQYRTGKFGMDYDADRYRAQNLGDLDEDGSADTDELFVLSQKKRK